MVRLISYLFTFVFGFLSCFYFLQFDYQRFDAGYQDGKIIVEISPDIESESLRKLRFNIGYYEMEKLISVYRFYKQEMKEMYEENRILDCSNN